MDCDKWIQNRDRGCPGLLHHHQARVFQIDKALVGPSNMTRTNLKYSMLRRQRKVDGRITWEERASAFDSKKLEILAYVVILEIYLSKLSVLDNHVLFFKSKWPNHCLIFQFIWTSLNRFLLHCYNHWKLHFILVFIKKNERVRYLSHQ